MLSLVKFYREGMKQPVGMVGLGLSLERNNILGSQRLRIMPKDC
jgi:hypothetical protein